MSNFNDMLEQLSGGLVCQALSDKLNDLSRAVNETNKSGSIAISITLKPNGEHGVTAATKIKTNVPERPFGDTMFFVTAAGHLMRDDPRQQALPLRRIEQAHGTPITIVEPVYDHVVEQ